MGADGGSIAKRSDILHGKINSNKRLEPDRSSLWTQCSLTHQKLVDPVVSDWNGSLYNKTAILELLLGTSNNEKTIKNRVAQIRDVVELQREFMDGNWIDPVSKKDLATEGSSEGFAYLAECGHISVISALKSVQSCPVCEISFAYFVTLNPLTVEARQSNQQRKNELDKLGLSNSLRPVKKMHQKRKIYNVRDSMKNDAGGDNNVSAKARKLAKPHHVLEPNQI